MYHHIDICDYIVLLACVDNAVLISYKISDNGVEKKYQIIKPQLTEGDGIGTLTIYCKNGSSDTPKAAITIATMR